MTLIAAAARLFFRWGWLARLLHTGSSTKANEEDVMSTVGNLGMNADDDGWVDEMAERWFAEFEEQAGEPSREDDAPLARGALPCPA